MQMRGCAYKQWSPARIYQMRKLWKLRPSGDLNSSLKALIESAPPSLRAEAYKLAGLWKLQSFQAQIEALALDGPATPDLRRASVVALAHFGSPESRETLAKLAAES